MSSSKNSNYADAQRYLQYKHREDVKRGRYEPVLDANGFLQERDHYGICALNGSGQICDPDDWVENCINTNLTYGKNKNSRDRKQMIFVISHPESDTPLLTKEALLEEGRAFVRANLQGYDALIAAHMDTDNYHVHIAINSVRASERPEQPWMKRDEDGNVLPSEMMAGGKHQNSPAFRRHCQQWLLDYTRSHGLTLEDNNRIEDQRKAERYTEKNELLRSRILDSASRSTSLETLCQDLSTTYEITLTRRGNTYTIHQPGAGKGKRLSSLNLTTEDLIRAMQISAMKKQQLLEAENYRIEKKKYIQWLRQRREKNTRKAEDMIADAAALIAVSASHHPARDFWELKDLIRQTAYVQRDLQTEMDKLDLLLERWTMYLDPAQSAQERERHRSYVAWCGCSPDSDAELQSLRNDRDVISLQIKETASVREALVQSADRWEDQRDTEQFHYRQDWLLSREAQLKQNLKSVRRNRKKLEQIAFRCEDIAGSRIYKQEYLQKAAFFREQWHKKLLQEEAVKNQLRKVKAERRKRRSQMER